MKNPITLLRNFSFLLFITLLAACSSYGTKVDFNGDEVYYTKNSNEQEAKMLGDYLKEQQYFTGQGYTVQLDKAGEKYICRFATKDSVENQESVIDGFKELGAGISEKVLNGKETDVDICDRQLKTKKTIAYADIQLYREQQKNQTETSPFGQKLDFTGGEVYYTTHVTSEEANRLGNFLVQDNFFSSEGFVSVQLDKSDDVYLFKMVSLDGVENEQKYIDLAKSYITALSTSVFNNAKVDFYFCDANLQTKKVIPFSSI